MNGARNVKLFLAPPPGALGRSQKVKYHLISITVNFKDFYTKLCVFSQMKVSKYIRRDFHSVPWVMPQGWDFGALGVPRGSKKKFKHRHVVYQIDGDDKQNRMQVHVKFSS